MLKNIVVVVFSVVGFICLSMQSAQAYDTATQRCVTNCIRVVTPLVSGCSNQYPQSRCIACAEDIMENEFTSCLESCNISETDVLAATGRVPDGICDGIRY